MRKKNYDDYIIIDKAYFDYVNTEAQVVIVGITPGEEQLDEPKEGQSNKEYKREHAFEGKMRPNLIAMLDHVGINGLLGIESCKSLWEEDFDKVEMTSLLKDASFICEKKARSKNSKPIDITGIIYYKNMLKDVELIEKSSKLKDLFNYGFVRDCALYTTAKLFVALGPGVYEKLNSLKENGVIGAEIAPILHPSGQNYTFRSGVFFHKEEINGRDKSYIKAYEFSDISKEIVRKL